MIQENGTILILIPDIFLELAANAERRSLGGNEDEATGLRSHNDNAYNIPHITTQ